MGENGRKIKAEQQGHSSAQAVKEVLKNGPVSIEMKEEELTATVSLADE